MTDYKDDDEQLDRLVSLRANIAWASQTQGSSKLKRKTASARKVNGKDTTISIATTLIGCVGCSFTFQIMRLRLPHCCILGCHISEMTRTATMIESLIMVTSSGRGSTQPDVGQYQRGTGPGGWVHSLCLGC